MKFNSTQASRSFGFKVTKTDGNLFKLFSVTVMHNFYTLNHGLCDDFTIQPTPTTASLMLSLGLIMRKEQAGFSIFIQQNRKQELVSYLRNNVQSEDLSSGYWERLTFSMHLINPLFVGITALPISTKTSQCNLYVSNLQAHQQATEVIRLFSGEFIGEESLFPVVGNEVKLTLPAAAEKITVFDVSGVAVIPPKDAPPVKIFENENDKFATLNFGGLPFGVYTIAVWGADNQPINEAGYPRKVLYVEDEPNAFILLDMFLTQPTPSAVGGYPVPPLFDPDGASGQWKTIEYQLPFNARSTYWQYFVVSQDPGGRLFDLEINGAGSTFQRDEHPAPLPDGSLAMVFTAQQALPLRQKSPQHFRLVGQRRDVHGQENAILISRLPVAANTPVWPAPDEQPISGLSEIFVYV